MAILGSASSDGHSVNPDTLRFGPGEAPVGRGLQFRDVDANGDVDLVARSTTPLDGAGARRRGGLPPLADLGRNGLSGLRCDPNHLEARREEEPERSVASLALLIERSRNRRCVSDAVSHLYSRDAEDGGSGSATYGLPAR